VAVVYFQALAAGHFKAAQVEAEQLADGRVQGGKGRATIPTSSRTGWPCGTKALPGG
jgi:hypothetical protein